MGFTFSHPALILPARYLPRKRYSMNGLIIGSMIPDVEYFIRLDNVSTFSHTFPGIFLFDLPAALIILTIYHQLIKEPLISNLPSFFKSRLQTYNGFKWPAYCQKNWAVISFSIVFGVLTHLLWDGFTSGNGYFVMRHPILEAPVSIFHLDLFSYKIIKHLSSLAGVLLLFYVLYKLPKKDHPTLPTDQNYWIWIISLTILITGIQLLTYYQHISANQLIKKIVSSGLLALISVSLYYRTKSTHMNTSVS